MSLAAKLPTVQALAAQAPAPPDAKDLANAEQLLEPAFVSEFGDKRLAARSRDALLADPHAGFALEAALTHSHPEVRAGAAFELGQLDRPAALVPLVFRLKYELDPTAKLWVADAVVRRGCGSGVDAILAGLASDATRELAGQRALDVFAQNGVALGESPSWASIDAALRQLQERWRTTGALRADLPKDDAGTQARLAKMMIALQGFQLRPVDDARFVLARVGKLALPLLREAIGATEPFLRTHGLEVLRDLGLVGAELAPAVLPLLKDPLSRVDASRALAHMRAKLAVPHLTAWLGSPDLELRTAAAYALGPLGDPATLPLLRAKLADEQETIDVRVMAAFSVALFELDRPAHRFLRELRDRKAYHEPTLTELLDKVDAWR
jgi:HEAT repeat protein